MKKSKSKVFNKQLTAHPDISHETLIQVLEKISKVDAEGYFTIEVQGRKIRCKQLG